MDVPHYARALRCNTAGPFQICFLRACLSMYRILFTCTALHASFKVCIDIPERIFHAPFQGEPYRAPFRRALFRGEPCGVLFRHAPFQGKPYTVLFINMLHSSTCSILLRAPCMYRGLFSFQKSLIDLCSHTLGKALYRALLMHTPLNGLKSLF